MSGSEIAALVAAGAFAVLVLALAVPILRLRRTVDATTELLREVTAKTGPILDGVNVTVDNVNTTLGQAQVTMDGLNVQLAKVDTMTQHLSATTANIANLVGVVTSTAAGPVAKAAALAYGVRKATAARTTGSS